MAADRFGSTPGLSLSCSKDLEDKICLNDVGSKKLVDYPSDSSSVTRTKSVLNWLLHDKWE